MRRTSGSAAKLVQKNLMVFEFDPGEDAYGQQRLAGGDFLAEFTGTRDEQIMQLAAWLAERRLTQ